MAAASDMIVSLMPRPCHQDAPGAIHRSGLLDVSPERYPPPQHGIAPIRRGCREAGRAVRPSRAVVSDAEKLPAADRRCKGRILFVLIAIPRQTMCHVSL